MTPERATPDAVRLLLQGSLALADVEHNGMRVDLDYLDRAGKDIDRRLALAEAELWDTDVGKLWRKTFPRDASLSSPLQMAEVIFGKMGFKPPAYTEKSYDAKGRLKADPRPKLDKHTFERIDLPFLRDYEAWKELRNAKGTFLAQIKREVVDGRVHPVINLNTVATYRSSCDSPNLQNMPIRDEVIGPLIRRCFVPSKGCRLVEVDFCLVGSTLVETIDGPRTIEEIVKAGVGKTHVYGYDHSQGRVGVSKIIRGKLTGKKQEVWRVTLDNGESVVGTPDHKFMLRDGSYVPLLQLKVGTSLMPFYKTTKKSRWGTCYSKIYLNNGQSMLAHNLIALDVMDVQIAGSDLVVHHYDGNGTNNSLSNIEIMTRSDHMKIHVKQAWKKHPAKSRKFTWQKSKANRERTKKMNAERRRTWSDKDWEEWRTRLSESLRRTGGNRGAKNPMYGRKHSSKSKKAMSLLKRGKRPACAGWGKGFTKDTHPSVRKISESRTGQPAWNKGRKLPPLSEGQKIKISKSLKGRTFSAATRGKISEARKRYWSNKPPETCKICGRKFSVVTYGHLRCEHGITVEEYRKTYNHKVVSIEFVGHEDVYNITVDRFHNYALSAGIIVANCALEFKIAACFWRCPEMVRYASDPTKDVHRDQAADCYWCKPKEVSKEMRFYAKNQFVFPTLYGSWWKKTAAALWEAMLKHKLKLADGTFVEDHLRAKGITELGACDPREGPARGTYEAHVKGVEKQFYERFPGFGNGKKPWLEKYRERGWFRLMTGFVVAGDLSNNDCLNYPVQGPAFHLLLASLIRVVKEIRRRKMKARVVNQIHDCILADVPEVEVGDFIELAVRTMTVDVPKSWPWVIVPLGAEVDVTPAGGSWADKKPWIKEGGKWRQK